MSKSVKGLLVGLFSLVVLALGVSAANAYTVSPGGSFTAASLGKLNLESDIVTLNCNVSLAGSLRTTIPNLGDNAGSVTSGSVTNCDDGFSVDLLFGSAWPLTAVSYTASGTGDIVLINISNVGFQVNFLGSPVCLFGGDVGFQYVEGGLITILANTLSGDCGTGSLAAGSQFALSPAQNITP